MALTISTKTTTKKRDAIIAVDLGARTSKAVYIQRKADKLVLSSYAVMDAPIYEKSLSAEMLAEHLKALCKTLDARTKHTVLVIGVNDSVVRHAEPPPTRPAAVFAGGELKKDPVCGTYVSTGASITSRVNGELVHFCSTACRDKYRAA